MRPDLLRGDLVLARATPATSRSSTSRRSSAACARCCCTRVRCAPRDIALPTEAKAETECRSRARSRRASTSCPPRSPSERDTRARALAGRARCRISRGRSGRRRPSSPTSTTGSTASSPPAAFSRATGCRRPDSAHSSKARAVSSDSILRQGGRRRAALAAPARSVRRADAHVADARRRAGAHRPAARAERLDLDARRPMPTGMTSAHVLPRVQAKEHAFETRHDAFERPRTKLPRPRSRACSTEFKALLPLTAFDDRGDDRRADEQNQIVVARRRTSARASHSSSRTSTSASPAVEAQARRRTTPRPRAEKRIQLLTDAGRARARRPVRARAVVRAARTQQAAEWTNAYADREHVARLPEDERDNDFAVDDWLYGVARVREKMHHVENLTFLAEALGTTRAGAAPVQFPYSAGRAVDGARVPAGSEGTARARSCCSTPRTTRRTSTAREPQCGLLLDEWTEVDSGRDRDDGHHVPLRQAERRAAAGDPAGHAAAVHRRVELGRSRADAARDARHGAPARGRAAAARPEPAVGVPAGHHPRDDVAADHHRRRSVAS